ncbi:protein-export membrane protein SecD [Hyphomicrobium denitrificans ATCC 51888]|uniref:Protein translocase subunit SecD n=1 Tax=Hyphomicrobium denitrificans (strain ATCC 51888 / DSM 1869 / NCIMB 11706 / TK 0415) TaxID=582899 RepID=D8JWH1_HYPDA|nr:protein translocase subunit SecD [Hyphomicrobium denitrificans]ADJ23084.1 protein-export membrane protein SecD [Hyphomicrobium denitrificans ATCC 51888]
MLHFTRWKIIATLLTCLAGLLVALPNFFPKETVQSWPSFMPKQQLTLGLDLQGGAHLLLAMDQDEIKKDWINNLRDEARKELRDAKIGFTGIGTQGLTQLVVKLAKPEEQAAALKALNKVRQPIGNALLGAGAYDVEVSSGTEPGTIVIKESDQGLRQRVANAASASIETINRRVNNLGTSESTIVRQGADRILIQFPGLKDTTDLKKLIGETAKLTFHEVHPSMSGDEAKMTKVPTGFKIYPGDKGESSGEYLLREQPVVQGADLADAQPGFDSRNGEPVINFRFNQIGARKFANFTKDHVGRPFAIVLDDKVLSAPVIREPILGGSGQISGSFTVEGTNTLAVQLRSGSLPTKLTIVEERTVGPSLGADSISAGKLAGVVGGIAVVILTILYYGTFGIFACVGLLVHLILTVALMTMIGAVLTLPGIAGLVLGVAMAVDANVLIYERIREELRLGKMPVSAIDAGFQRAYVTILDSQLTTLACAIIMFWLGSGPIRGFAVTLTIGILTSIFASVTVVRLLISYWLRAQPKGRAIYVPV